MREQIEARLAELRAEYEAGQARLHQVEAEAIRLRETLLRISGAAQVLEELLAEGRPTARDAAGDQSPPPAGAAPITLPPAEPGAE